MGSDGFNLLCLIGIGGGFAAPPLPHHRTYGSVYGGSVILALTGWRFETPSANVGFTAHPIPFGLHPIRTRQAQPQLIGWCLTTHEVGVLLLLITVQAFVTAVTTMPSADFCRSVTRDCSRVSLLRDKQQISRGKSNRFQRTTAGFTNRCP
jgi:hypothetical protein